MTEIIPFDNNYPPRPAKHVIEVLIVASQELIRDVVRGTLSSVERINVIGEAKHGAEAMQAVEELKPDVVVIESQIGPDAEGVRSGYRFKAARPSMGVVVIAQGFGEDVVQYLSEKASSGWSFVTRAAALDSSRLWRAVDGAYRGNGVVDPVLEREEPDLTGPVLERLTSEQCKALELLAAGISDTGIAAQLDLTASQATELIESLYDDLRIDTGPRVDRRVIAVLVYLRETVRLRS